MGDVVDLDDVALGCGVVGKAALRAVLDLGGKWIDGRDAPWLLSVRSLLCLLLVGADMDVHVM